jgi:hypothetical protein
VKTKPDGSFKTGKAIPGKFTVRVTPDTSSRNAHLAPVEIPIAFENGVLVEREILLYSITTSTTELENSHMNLTAYPNPFSASVSLDLDIPDNVKNLSLVISDNYGNLIHQNEISEVYVPLKYDMAPTLPDGIYFASIWSDGRILKTIKLIKSN